MKVLALIPGRGGSKGIKDKNIIDVAGRPLLAYAIEAAQEAQKVSRVLVNTDSEKIAAVAREYQAEVMMRPAELATDSATTTMVIHHLLEELEKQNDPFDLIVILQITAPIRTGKNIDEVVAMFEKDPTLPAVISVVAMDDVHPARMYKLGEEADMQPLVQEWETARRQDIPPVYYRNGCIYAIRPEALRKTNSLMPPGKKAYVMPSQWLANIDDMRDLMIARVLVQAWKAGEI